MGHAGDPASDGRRMLEECRFEEALDVFERALAADPENPDLWNGKGAALRSMGRYDEAVRCFERSLGIEPRDRNAS